MQIIILSIVYNIYHQYSHCLIILFYDRQLWFFMSRFFMQCAFDSEQRLRFDSDRLMRISSRLQDNLEPVKSVRTTGRHTNRGTPRTTLDRSANPGTDRVTDRGTHRSRTTSEYQKSSRLLKPLVSERTPASQSMGQLTAMLTSDTLDKSVLPTALPRLPVILQSSKEENKDKQCIDKNTLPSLETVPTRQIGEELLKIKY